jgi:hypothetical protein
MRARLLCCSFGLALAACGQPAESVDAASGSADAMEVHVDDGAPMRRTCTTQLGSALTSTYGRLDGFLVAIVPAGGNGCGADDSHIHLQVLANGSVYDVAVNVGSPGVDDVRTMTLDRAFEPWVEGWHTGVAQNYVSLGVHSTDLPAQTTAQVINAVTADLATANHISVFAIGYGPDGVHLVHRNGSSHDGLLITEPLSTPAHARLFSFADLTF